MYYNLALGLKNNYELTVFYELMTSNYRGDFDKASVGILLVPELELRINNMSN